MTGQREGRAMESMMTRLLVDNKADSLQAATMSEWRQHVAASTVFGGSRTFLLWEGYTDLD